MDIIENTATPANPTQEEQLHSSSSAGHDNTAIDVNANVKANEDDDVNCGIRTNEKPISSTNSNTMYSDIDNNNDKKIDNLNNDNHNIMNESNDSSSSQQSETEIETEHFSSLFERADMNMNMNTNTSMNAHIDADVDVDGRLNAQAGLHVDVHVDDGNESSAEEEEEVIHQSQEEEGIDIPEEAEDRSNDSSHGHGHDDGGGIFPNNNTNTNNNTNNNNINNNNNRRTNNNNNILSYLIPILAILWHACMLWFRFFCSTITFSIPTKQLHIISIVLLCIHQIVQKIIEYIPHVWLMVFDIIGHEHMPQELKGFILSASSFGTGVMNGTGPGAGSGMAKSDSIVTEMEFLKLVLEKLIGQFLPNSTEVLQEIDGIGSGSSTSPSILKLLEKPIISIMIPTTILSIFLLITMTVFLCVHMSFQAFVYVSSYFSGDNEQGGVSLSSSPFVLWGILSILILETVLPWICLSVGVYLSFSVGGCIWSLFVVSMYLLWVGLRRLRSRVYLGTMPGEV